MLRWVGALGWLAGILATAAEAQVAGNAVELEIEAAYLLNFTRYVDWPATAFTAPGDAVTLCVVGDEQFGAILRATVAGRRSRGRPLQVTEPDAPAAARGCHVLFLGSRGTTAGRWLDQLRDSPVLTVGEGRDFVTRGGMIAFVLVNQTIRFEIAALRARQAGLQISSRVLSLATRLHGRAEP
jgi:hypothetical protein